MKNKEQNVAGAARSRVLLITPGITWGLSVMITLVSIGRAILFPTDADALRPRSRDC